MSAVSRSNLYRWSIAILFLLASGCATNRVDRRIYRPAAATPGDLHSHYLKVHMTNGDVYVLDKWSLGKPAEVSGEGKLFDYNRHLMQSGKFTIPFKDIALFETNDVSPQPQIAVMALMTGVSLAMTIYCIANPKACFGSCPTFYAWDGKRMQVLAEGFSASIAPALEERDIDALYRAKPPSRNLEVWITNEALETHVIRYAAVLLARRPDKGRVFVTPSGKFYQANSICPPASAMGDEGDFSQKLAAVDGNERFSSADSTDLASREEILLKFKNAPEGRLGLVLGYRQTLLTTFLFYQELAYMGSHTGDWIAGLKQDQMGFAKAIKSQLWGALGTIEILAQDRDGQWIKQGEVSEVGPIATNVELVPLTVSSSKETSIKLRLTRGLWRLDYAALVRIGNEIEPMRVFPSSVVRGDSVVDPGAKDKLSGTGGPLVTLPGDKYSALYRLPDNFRSCELFLDTKGYYLEWMRKEWEKEEDPEMALMMFGRPATFFKLLAPEFKKIEPRIEQDFWSSKYVEH